MAEEPALVPSPEASLDYFRIDRERLTRGSQDLDLVLRSMDRHEKREFLMEDFFKDGISAVLIGIKPACSISTDSEKKVAERIHQKIESGELPGDYVVSNGLFYSKSKEQAVLGNTDVFTDYEPGSDIDSYLQRTFDMSHNQSEDTTRRVGHILGYPAEAADAYAKYQEFYSKFDGYVREHRKEDPILDGYYLDFSNPDDIERCNQFRNEHRDEVRQKLNEIEEFKNLPSEAKDYIADMRGVKTRGYSFAIPATSQEYKTFAGYVERAFEQSGVDEVITKHFQEVMTPDYEQDFEIVVDGVAGAMDNEIVNYLMWNIMKPEERPDNLFREFEQEMTEMFLEARQVTPDLEHDNFETDLKAGISKVRDAIAKATEDTDGSFAPGTGESVYPQFEKWTTRNILILLGRGGIDIKPIVEKFQNEPNTSVADICREFFMKSG